MGTLTYTDLVEVDLTNLMLAADDWKSVVDGLKKLVSDARSGLLKKSEGARWAGLNATVTHEFVRKTTKEFEDLHKEASSIYAILDDAYDQLTEMQDTVKRVVVRAEVYGYKFSDNSDGTVSFDVPEGDDSRLARDLGQSYANTIKEKLAGPSRPTVWSSAHWPRFTAETRPTRATPSTAVWWR
ncbi:hypothetical protein B7755_010255 [Streptomyces sp. NBS 14/10]|uniref:hypothetical protein n=1 Tax=Streptomyces sp. NBS 14/10 TaxID=1945643 RepID=UPI00211AE933|nr:hypothetical protein [Streptomyces sp. NBS 14/10]KAK1178481.1 hypothetical protein B7755_010255 [Streptomyces sp. NBS 14/10]